MRYRGTKYIRARQAADDDVIRKAAETHSEHLKPIAFQ